MILSSDFEKATPKLFFDIGSSQQEQGIPRGDQHGFQVTWLQTEHDLQCPSDMAIMKPMRNIMPGSLKSTGRWPIGQCGQIHGFPDPRVSSIDSAVRINREVEQWDVQVTQGFLEELTGIHRCHLEDTLVTDSDRKDR